MSVRRGPFALVICAAAIAAPFPATAQGPGPTVPKVRVATTGSHSELRRTLPISGHPGGRGRVVMSLGPRELPSLATGDRLKLSSELQLTANCIVREPRCVGPPYRYSPRVRAQLVLAPDARASRGGKVMPLGEPEREVCGNRLPYREHHCVIVFRGLSHRFAQGEELPCRLHSCHVNLVVEAHSGRAGPRDLIMVGGLKPNGHIPQDRGRLNAIRISPQGDPGGTLTETGRRRRKGLRPNHRGRVAYSMRLDGLREGEQLEVEGALETEIGHLPYNTLTATQLVLATSPGAIRPGRRSRSVATTGGEIDERNAFNCTQNRPSCMARKVGVLRISRDSVDGRGRPVPLYVNLVVVSGAKRAAARRDDRIRVTRAGGLRVVRYPASSAG